MKKMLRYAAALLGLAITVGLCWFLDGLPIKSSKLAFGRVLDPFHGFWQNMESPDIAWSESEALEGLQGKVTVKYDSLRIPHIFAENDHDLYFAQGYVTARDRLFQMEFQTHAAAGRLSEIIGDPRVLAIDRARRRTGMVYGAEKSLKAMNADPVTKLMIEAYSDGVNAYINSLSYAELPMEYKLLDFRPEPWTPFKSALLLKFMAWDLTGRSDDFVNTNALIGLGIPDFNRLYPTDAPMTSPIAPVGTPWAFTPTTVQAPDSFAPLSIAPKLLYPQPDPQNGSNNWVVAGSKTASGHPILCDDPHLSLRLPSLWYEVQLSTPEHNTYGVSLPGSPAIIIGFNQHVSWGVTNASRDVQDWYTIEFQDDHRKAYRYDGQWLPTTERVEVIKRRYDPEVRDTILFTVHGPVVYDRSYSDPDSAGPVNVAMRWAGHDSTNELKTFYLLNRAKNHDDYRAALRSYACPGQNFVFACSDGDIAITQQGRFPVKWRGQGQFVMDGAEKLNVWQAYIPAEQNPYAKNPERGFLFSSNQHPTDSTYPYDIAGSYDYTRNLRISSALQGMQGIKVEDMFRLQNDNYNEFAAIALPTLLRSLNGSALKPNAQRATGTLAKWNYMNDADLEAPSIWHAWSQRLFAIIWEDDLIRIGRSADSPEFFNTLVWATDSAGLPEVDDARTPAVETLADVAARALNEAMTELDSFALNEKVPYIWQNYNNVVVMHLTRQMAFSFDRLPTGGGAGIVNANRKNNGASWRMVVEMGPEPNAYGVFPGGQSGNPGSHYYNRSLSDWAAGRYHKLLLLKDAQQDNPSIQFTQTLNAK